MNFIATLAAAAAIPLSSQAYTPDGLEEDRSRQAEVFERFQEQYALNTKKSLYLLAHEFGEKHGGAREFREATSPNGDIEILHFSTGDDLECTVYFGISFFTCYGSDARAKKFYRDDYVDFLPQYRSLGLYSRKPALQ